MRKLEPMKLRKWQSKPMERPPNNEEAIYLSGLIDGEGCFIIRRYTYKSMKKGLLQYYKPLLIVGMNDPLLKEFWELYGGGLTQHPPPPKTKTQNYYYLWRLYKHETLKLILQRILPFLKVKREHAILLLHALETTDKQELEKLKQMISKLNNKHYGRDPMFYPEKRKD